MFNDEYEISEILKNIKAFIDDELHASWDFGYITHYPKGFNIKDIQLLIEDDSLIINVCVPKDSNEADPYEQLQIAKEDADEFLKGTSFEKFDHNDLGEDFLILYSLELDQATWPKVKKSLEILFQTHKGLMWKKLRLIQGGKS